jgi:hypothetical protein
MLIVLLLSVVVAWARLPYCEWCKYEDDQEELFNFCRSLSEKSQKNAFFIDAKCHDAWRHALATRVVTAIHVALPSNVVAPNLMFELQGGVRALYRDACRDDLNRSATSSAYYFDIVAHQVDRAVGIHRVPAIQLRQFHTNALLAIPRLSDEARARILADKEVCFQLRTRLHTNKDAMFGLLVGLPPAANVVTVPALPLQLSSAFAESKSTNIVGALDSLEVVRYLLLLYLMGDLDSVLRDDGSTPLQALRVDDGPTLSLLVTDLRSSHWSTAFSFVPESTDVAEPLDAADAVFPQGCSFETGRCADLALESLRSRVRSNKSRKDVLLVRWLGALLGALCQLPRDVARRASSLHTDSVRAGVFVAHAVKEAIPDMDEDDLATLWAERTQYTNVVMDKRIRSIHQMVETCSERHGAINVLVPNADEERRAELEQHVLRWVREKHARYADPAVRDKHLADYAASRYNGAAESRRLSEALVEQADAGGVRDCAQFARHLVGATPLASNGKKVVYHLAEQSLALKHSVSAEQVEHNDKTLWKLGRVPEKQRRDLLYERWLLPRLAHIDGIVQLHAALNLSECAEPELRAIGVANVVEFVPGRIEVESLFAGGDGCVALGLAVEGAELLLDFERGDKASDSSLFMCDWKLDNFGISQAGRLRLFDVDSIQLYPRSTHYLWQKYCDEEDPRDVRKFKTECMQPCGAFRNSMRVGHSPAELYCNATTRLCDGFDSHSNVWGYCAAVLPAILGGAPYSHDVHRAVPQREQLAEILKHCSARDRDNRMSADELYNQLSFIFKTECRREARSN